MKTLVLVLALVTGALDTIAWGQMPGSAPGGRPVAPSPIPVERFREESGALRDIRTGLLWTQSDSGSDTSWKEAANYCRSKGTGWGLPSADELQGLYDAAQSVPCGRWICHASPKFRLAGPWFWSNEPSGPSEAWFVYLTVGTRNSVHVGKRFGIQALCVRRS